MGVLAVLIAIVITSAVVFLLMIRRHNANKEKKINKVARKMTGIDFKRTVKPAYNDHPWDPKISAVVSVCCKCKGSKSRF